MIAPSLGQVARGVLQLTPLALLLYPPSTHSTHTAGTAAEDTAAILSQLRRSLTQFQINDAMRDGNILRAGVLKHSAVVKAASGMERTARPGPASAVPVYQRDPARSDGMDMFTTDSGRRLRRLLLPFQPVR
jgi:hypothetical protein